MSARVIVAVLAVLTVIANVLLGVGWPRAVVAGMAVFVVGEAVGRVLGARPLPAAVVAAGSHPLSRREVEVAVLIAQGLTSKEVGRKLFIERATVDTHVQHIYNKLGIDSRPQLAVWLMEHGLLERANPAR
jgi:DNA-binding NarL/FixJ family response regulator